jgi:ABC-type Fe3+-hydroxamate transport system substrate-binding protein
MPSDDLGHHVDLAPRPQRIVSLVPSLTEALAHSVPDRLVGATDWCTHPPDLSVTRVRGTKNPDVEAIVSLRPALVVANAEENRTVDLDLLRATGMQVWVTDIRTVDGALTSLDRLLDVIGGAATGWLDDARRAWASPSQVASQRIRAVVPIWRRPWMHVGSDTYAGDVLRRLGVDNALADHSERYPAIALDELPEHDLGGTSRRAVRLQPDRRAGGVRRALRTRQRPLAHLVRPSHGGRAFRPARPTARGALNHGSEAVLLPAVRPFAAERPRAHR